MLIFKKKKPNGEQRKENKKMPTLNKNAYDPYTNIEEVKPTPTPTEQKVPYLEAPVLSVQAATFTNKETGETRNAWKLFLADPTGAVGSVWSTEPYALGTNVKLVLAVGKDGKFTVKVSK